ncbi:MAG: 5'-deoxynucleotidase [Eubacteriales bacterium]|nr:5'-deoxynucleotidase [Eubacteriales bacterium]
MGQNFYAMLHRMRYINRWGLMRNTQTENIQEHSLEVAIIAHALAEIRSRFYAADRVAVDPAKVALLAIFHDAAEILTGDLPTPVKYYNPTIKDAYQAVEAIAAEQLLMLVSDDLKDAYRELLIPDRQDHATDEAMRLVKAADRISAYIKCIDEEKAGNREFHQAGESIRESLARIDLPEVRHFIEQELPSFHKSLDDLQIGQLN